MNKGLLLAGAAAAALGVGYMIAKGSQGSEAQSGEEVFVGGSATGAKSNLPAQMPEGTAGKGPTYNISVKPPTMPSPGLEGSEAPNTKKKSRSSGSKPTSSIWHDVKVLRKAGIKEETTNPNTGETGYSDTVAKQSITKKEAARRAEQRHKSPFIKYGGVI